MALYITCFAYFVFFICNKLYLQTTLYFPFFSLTTNPLILLHCLCFHIKNWLNTRWYANANDLVDAIRNNIYMFTFIDFKIGQLFNYFNWLCCASVYSMNLFNLSTKTSSLLFHGSITIMKSFSKSATFVNSIWDLYSVCISPPCLIVCWFAGC